MTLLAFTTLDYAVLVGYLLLMIVIGALFSRQQHTSRDFFLAGRGMSWFPVGLSITATLLSALSYTGAPAEASQVGLKLCIWPLTLWLNLPIVLLVVLPLYRNLEITSIYEYLELRFDAKTRVVGSVIFVLWRLIWLGGVLYAPCKVLVVAAGLDISLPILLVVLGFVSTLYTYLGGMKAVIWTDVIQTVIMLVGLAFIIGGVWASIDGGAARVWSAAQELGHTEIFQVGWEEDSSFWTEKWLIWAMVPHFFLASLSFYVADQITAQRYLTTKNTREAQRAFTLNCLSVNIFYPLLAYVGIALSVYYLNDASDMEADALLPQFIVQVLPAGVAGLIFAALLAASMSSMDSGLNSIATLLMTDGYRRWGWGKDAWARVRKKEPGKLNQADELLLARVLVLLIGVGATGFALWVSTLGSIFDIMVGVVNTFGGPLLSVFLLGMLTRRCSAAAALGALSMGMVLTVWLAFGADWGIWPWRLRLNAVWPLTIGVAATLVAGYLLSFCCGKRKTDDQLQGLVVGLGPLGCMSR
ncbi:sodium/solute symporter [Pirellulales bacterium]|nr:sodium/solute symporter [Pirellulales bacterium]